MCFIGPIRFYASVWFFRGLLRINFNLSKRFWQFFWEGVFAPIFSLVKIISGATRHNKKDGGMSMKKMIFWRIWMDGDYSLMVLHTTKFHSELLYFLRTFACVSCPVCRIIGKVNWCLHCSDVSISQCSWAVKNPVFNRWSRSVDSRIHAKEVSISMKLDDLSKSF